MRKSTYKFVAGLFAIALLAAGCSSSSDSASEETAATEESAAPAAAEEKNEFKVTLKEAIGDLAKLKIGSTNEVKNHEFYDSGYSSIFLSRNRVRGWDEQSFTILATDRHIPFHPQAPKMIKLGANLRGFVPGYEDKYRRLTIRECARIQTFPDDYEFLYNHMRHGYKMIGNAVPPHFSKKLALALKELFKNLS